MRMNIPIIYSRIDLVIFYNVIPSIIQGVKTQPPDSKCH